MNYNDYIARKIHQNGLKFDDSELSKQFIPYFETGQRIIVKSKWGEVMRGYVGVTTGWKPSFMLLKRRNSSGSSELLDDSYEIIGTMNKYLRYY